jgi:hypothetical protein
MEQSSFNNGGIYLDICRGYSETFLKKKVYLKHFGSIDYALIDDYTFKSIDKYKQKGALSKEDLIKKKIEENLWSEDKDKQIKSLENNIQIMFSRRSKALFESQIEEIDSIIKDYENKYYSLLNQRESLLRLSAETLANSSITEFIIHLSFYKDEHLQNKFFDLEEVIDFDDDELYETINCYKDSIERFNLKNIKKVSLNRKIADFIKNSSNAESFFGRSGYLITQNQITLFENCKYFLSLLEHIKDITDEERQDPDEVEKIFIAQMNAKKEKPAASSESLKTAANAFKNS